MSITLKAVSTNTFKKEEVFKDRTLKIDYYGYAENKYSVESETNNDSTSQFNDVTYEIKTCNIKVIYHDEGTSGLPELSYYSVKLTSYNYTSYIGISEQHNSRQEENNKNGIITYTTYNYVSYTINCSTLIKGLFEFVDTIIYLDNGESIKLNAVGHAGHTSKEYLSTEEAPKIIKVEGRLDYYPSATYNN